MKKVLHLLLLFLLLSFSHSGAWGNKDTPLFKENKGQITDQNGNPRPDILYYGSSDGLSYFLKKTGISYQLYQKGKQNEITISRIDMTWLGANPDAKVVADNKAVTTDNFYNTPNKDGIIGVRNFGDLQYKNIYKDIDLHYYYSKGSLKYDFIVAPNADYKLIQIKIDGSTSIRKNGDGTLSINTLNGILKEGTPVAFQNGKEIKSSWILKDNTLSFSIDNYDSSLPLTIDPLVYQWQAHDGNSGQTGLYNTTYNCVTNDNFGNSYATRNYVFGAGVLASNYSFLNKFDANGATVWSTPTSTVPAFLTGCSFSNNYIYVCGATRTSSTVATTGAYQATLAGQSDSYLMKFDSSGTKIWGTYYGGTGVDSARSCKADALGNVYVCGITNSTGNISSVGSYMQSFGGAYDAFVAKFDSAGIRKWGTYFGGNDIDYGESVDIHGNRIFITGSTKSTSGIALGTVQQSVISGNINSFLLCMDTAGANQWSTYYGADSTFGENCAVSNNYVYLCGTTKGTTNIATSGAFQTTNGGGYDGFLAKFSMSGARIWGTYYGGSNNETAKGNTVGSNGNIFICGNTKSSNGIATPWSFHPAYIDNNNTNGSGVGVAYLAEIDTNGQRKYGTYFTDTFHLGQNGYPNSGYGGCTSAEACAAGINGTITLVGTYLYMYGDYIGYRARFSTCNDTTPDISSNLPNICSNGTAQISTSIVAGATYQWYRNDTLITGASGNIYNTSVAGSYRVQVNHCPSAVSSAISINTYPVPTTSITKADAPCTTAAIGSITVTASGGTSPYSYTWDNSANTTNTLSGLIPGTYVVHTSDVHSCTKHDTVTIANTMNIPSTQIAVANVPCYGSPIGSIEVTASGGTPPYSYAWDNSANTTNVLSGLATGDYIVHTIDANTCEKIDSVTVGQNTTTAPSDPLASICAVTVDSATGKNLVIWEKNGTVNAIAYNVYRESIIAGQYHLIGTNAVDEFSTFLDTASVPLQQSYSYKIAEIDSCDHEWPMSDLHKTIHLSSNVGINGEVNLSWNQYEGKPYNTHNIMRSFNGGPFTLLNQVSSTITSYSDLTPPTGNSVYRIEIDLSTECNPSKPTSVQLIRSNTISHSDPTSISNIPDIGNIHVMPNPTTGRLLITGIAPAQIRIYDAFGRLLLNESNTNKMDISKFAKGMYMIRLVDKTGTVFYSQRVLLK